MKVKTTLLLTGSLCLALSGIAPAQAQQFDEEAAKALFKKNGCTKCHAPDKNKKGPSLKKMAQFYKDPKNAKGDPEKEAIKHMTSGMKVKLEDGTEDDHKIIDTKDPKELSNVARYILAQ